MNQNIAMEQKMKFENRKYILQVNIDFRCQVRSLRMIRGFSLSCQVRINNKVVFQRKSVIFSKKNLFWDKIFFLSIIVF